VNQAVCGGGSNRHPAWRRISGNKGCGHSRSRGTKRGAEPARRTKRQSRQASQLIETKRIPKFASTRPQPHIVRWGASRRSRQKLRQRPICAVPAVRAAPADRLIHLIKAPTVPQLGTDSLHWHRLTLGPWPRAHGFCRLAVELWVTGAISGASCSGRLHRFPRSLGVGTS
jgi:hypothetical protein